uniref:DUF2523 domain-containing protein n=1 Tax=Dulem virus 65 TaxID=3145776 RepID=A0AAU8B8H2_9VIRU
MINIGNLFTSFQRGFLRNMLEGAGLTLATAGISLTAFNTAVNHFKSSLAGVSASLLQLAGLAGFDVSFSIILGAIVSRYIKQNTQLFLKRK